MAWDVTIKKNATIEDTLRLIVQAVNNCATQQYAKHVAEVIGNVSATKLDFLKNLFTWVKQNVRYVQDVGGIERVYTPDRTIREGAGDCKKMTVLIASVLKAAGFDPILKHVVYGAAEKWTHIYVIVPKWETEPGAHPMVWKWPASRQDYYVLDPTITGGHFNQEVTYKSGMMMNLNGVTSKPMDLHMMGNPNEKKFHFNGDVSFLHESIKGASKMLPGKNTINLHPAVLKHLKMPNTTVHQAVTKALFPNGTPKVAEHTANIPYDQQRGAFLELIKHNYNGLATHLLQALGKDPNALNNVWHIVGGDPISLKETILKAAKLPAATGDETAGEPSLIGKHGFFKKLLHGAATVLHAVAPVVNTIIPGAGVAINNIAAKAENIANNIPVKTDNGQLAPPPPHTDIPIDKNGIPFGNQPHGGSMAMGIEAGKPFLTAIKCFIYGSFQLIGLNQITHNNPVVHYVGGLSLISACVVAAIISIRKNGNI